MTSSVPPTENQTLPKSRFAGRSAAIAWLVAGLGLGVGGTLMLAKPEAEVRTVVMAPLRPPKTSPQNPKLDAQSPVKPVSVSTMAPKEKEEPRQFPDLPMTTPPASPFGPSMDLLSQLPKAPKPLKGSLPKVPMLPPQFIAHTKPGPSEQPGGRYLNDIIEKGVPKPPPALRPSDQSTTATATVNPPKATTTLLTIREIATNAESQADDFASFAKSLNGSAEILVDRAHGVSEKDRKTTVVGLLVTLPPSAVDAFQAHLKDGSAFVDASTWTGTPEARRSRLTDEARTRLASLESLRGALLSTYMADAGPVKDVDDDIARAKKILDQLKADPSTDANTIVRIVFVSK